MSDDETPLGATPYREAPTQTVRPVIGCFEAEWRDGDDPSGGFSSNLLAAGGAVMAVFTAQMMPPLGIALASATLGWWVWQRQRVARARIRAEVHGEMLWVWCDGADTREELPLAVVREVSLERRTTQRVIHRREIGDAVPTTALSGDIDLARIVLLRDDGEGPLRLSERYASNLECMEHYGKLRVFLRSHGWLPEDERREA